MSYFAVDVKKQKHFHNGMFLLVHKYVLNIIIHVTSIVDTTLRFHNNAHELGNTFDFMLYRDDKLLFVYLSDLFRQLHIYTTHMIIPIRLL